MPITRYNSLSQRWLTLSFHLLFATFAVWPLKPPAAFGLFFIDVRKQSIAWSYNFSLVNAKPLAYQAVELFGYFSTKVSYSLIAAPLLAKVIGRLEIFKFIPSHEGSSYSHISLSKEENFSDLLNSLRSTCCSTVCRIFPLHLIYHL